MHQSLRLSVVVALGLLAPALLGAKGDGCAAGSKSPAPDVSGTWSIDYDDKLGVEIKIGGEVFKETLDANGGKVDIQYKGIPISFNLDCARDDIVCPSEGWPTSVSIEQRNEELEHQMVVTIPKQTCDGKTVKPAADQCGAGTRNPSCDPVCDGEVKVTDSEAFGVIGENGESFRLFLGGGIATNGINCALLAYSVADASLATEGKSTERWRATEMTDGEVTVGYAGGCLWVQQANMDPNLEATILGAEVKFTTGFTGTRDE